MTHRPISISEASVRHEFISKGYYCANHYVYYALRLESRSPKPCLLSRKFISQQRCIYVMHSPSPCTRRVSPLSGTYTVRKWLALLRNYFFPLQSGTSPNQISVRLLAYQHECRRYAVAVGGSTDWGPGQQFKVLTCDLSPTRREAL